MPIPYMRMVIGVCEPNCLSKLSKLTHLNLRENKFDKEILRSLGALPVLKSLDLSYNNMWPLSSQDLCELTKLEELDLGETENLSWQPLFQLKVLVMSHCNINKPIGNIPKFLYDQHELVVVAITHSRLNGSFPIWLLENNTRLQVLNLRRNSFTAYQYIDLHWLDVSDNHLHGELQKNIRKMIPKLEYLNLYQNHFEGDLPSSIGDMSNLYRLDLSFNEFSGEIPVELIANCTYLKFSRLSNNNFHGEIFSKSFNQSLFLLELNNNNFTGTLPVVPLHVGMVLNIRNNYMFGRIPAWMVNDNSSKIVDLSNNFFEGQIPCGLGSFDVINLSHNLLSGFLPSCLNLRDVRHILLRGNKLTGSLPKVVFNSSSLLTVDIRDNSFSGSIPEGISELSNSRVLLLSGNHFSGMIHKQMCQLKKLGIMDLSKNFLTGTIPFCFHNITFGKLNDIDF
ncbi:receptor-like protein 1, partial [Quercus suber]